MGERLDWISEICEPELMHLPNWGYYYGTWYLVKHRDGKDYICPAERLTPYCEIPDGAEIMMNLLIDILNTPDRKT